MAESEKKDGQVPEAKPIAADAKELTDESLENVAGGLGPPSRTSLTPTR
jgi:hypothetical protein